MFYFINKNIVLQLILLIGLLVLSGFQVFTSMDILPPEGQMVMYQTLFPMWQAHPLHYRILAMILLVAEVLLLQSYYRINNFSEQRSYMPSVFLLAFLNLTGDVKLFSPILFTIVSYTTLLILNSRSDRESPFKSSVFFSGIWVGLALLFDPIAIWMVLFVILTLMANQFASFKEVLIFLLGFITTLIYIFAYYFFADKLPQLFDILAQYPYFGIFKAPNVWSVINMITAAFAGLLAVYLIITLKVFFDNKLIVLRKRLISVHFLIMVCIIMMLFSMYNFKIASGYVFIPFALYFAMLSNIKNYRLMHDILIVALLVLSCF